MNHRFVAATAALVLGLGAVVAASAEGTLTLEAARSAALTASAALKKATLAVDSAKLDEKIQSYAWLPSGSLGAGGSFSYPQGGELANGASASVQVSVSQTVWDFGKNRILAAIDALSTQAARSAARQIYFSVLDDVDAAYFGYLEAQASVEAAKADKEAAELLLRLAEAKREAGTVTDADVLQAEANAAEMETALSQARRDLAVYGAKLASLTGYAKLPAVSEVDFSSFEDLISRSALYGDDQAGTLITAVRAAALAANPSLAQTATERDIAASSVDSAKADYLPSVSAGWTHSLSVSGIGETESDGSLSLSASIPLDFWTTSASVESKKIAAEQASLVLLEAERSLALDIDTAVYDCISQARTVLSSKKAADYAEAHYRSVLEQYRLQAASVSDLSDAEATLSGNRKSYISARYGFLACLSTLRSLGAFESEAQLLELMP